MPENHSTPVPLTDAVEAAIEVVAAAATESEQRLKALAGRLPGGDSSNYIPVICDFLASEYGWGLDAIAGLDNRQVVAHVEQALRRRAGGRPCRAGVAPEGETVLLAARPADPPPAARGTAPAEDADGALATPGAQRAAGTGPAVEGPAPEKGAGTPASVPRFEIRNQGVYIDGKHEPLKARSAQRKRILYMLHCYVAARDYTTDEQLDNLAAAAGQKCGHWERIRKAVPAPIWALFETHPQKGSRFKADS
jgi:hypothetical protein